MIFLRQSLNSNATVAKSIKKYNCNEKIADQNKIIKSKDYEAGCIIKSLEEKVLDKDNEIQRLKNLYQASSQAGPQKTFVEYIESMNKLENENKTLKEECKDLFNKVSILDKVHPSLENPHLNNQLQSK